MPTPPIPPAKFADKLRAEFFDALARERAEREDGYRKEAAERRKFSAEMRSRLGGFTNNEGKILEGDTIHALGQLRTVGDLPVKAVFPSMQLPGKKREYDGMLYCPEAGAVVLLEIKRHFAVGDVRKFVVKQMPDFRRDFPDLINGAAVYGAIVGSLLDDAARDLAEEKGLFVLHVGTNRRVEVVSAPSLPRP